MAARAGIFRHGRAYSVTCRVYPSPRTLRIWMVELASLRRRRWMYTSSAFEPPAVEALLAVADAETSLIISGNGDIIEPDDGIIAIGSGGSYALSAARALLAHTDLDARTVATEALNIAGDICIYTNRNVVVEEL